MVPQNRERKAPLVNSGEPRAVKTFGEDRTLIYSLWEREIMDAAAWFGIEKHLAMAAEPPITRVPSGGE